MKEQPYFSLSKSYLFLYFSVSFTSSPLPMSFHYFLPISIGVAFQLINCAFFQVCECVSMHVCVRKKESTKEMSSECERYILCPFISVHQSMCFQEAPLSRPCYNSLQIEIFATEPRTLCHRLTREKFFGKMFTKMGYRMI